MNGCLKEFIMHNLEEFDKWLEELIAKNGTTNY